MDAVTKDFIFYTRDEFHHVGSVVIVSVQNDVIFLI